MSTAYDEVSYPSAIYAETHPDRLAVIATLTGLNPAPVTNCRVLELGCGDGFNLIAMAHALPGSSFVGLDLASVPISRGNAVIQRLGLKNVELAARDVTHAGPGLGQFDYIIAHGLYSWVPDFVRAKIMEICRENLAPQGVAYISYNAYPGNHARDLVRGMMRYHVAEIHSPADKIAQARALVKMLSGAGDPKDPYMQMLERERERVEKYTDSGFFHDDLSDTNQPFYFHEFMAQAERSGLQFLGEAELTEKQALQCPPHVQAALAQIDPANVVAAEQYRDFARCRAFRRTLLCHQGVPLNRGLDAAHMERLFVAGSIRSATPSADPNGVEVFAGQKKSEVETNRPLMKAALRRIGAAWPDYLPVPELIAAARKDANREGEESVETDAAELCGALLQAGIAGVIDVHAHRPHLILNPGERPVASSLARMQAAEGNRVSTCFHTIVQMEDGLSRLMLQLVDGTRDRAALVQDLQNAVRAGKVDAPVTAEQITIEQVDAVLRRFGSLGLLSS